MTRLVLVLLFMFGSVASADPTRYILQTAQTEVGLIYEIQGDRQRATIPVDQATVWVDLDDLSASSFNVRLNADRARAGFVILTEALKSEALLHTAQFPEVRFVSRRVTLAPSGLLSDGAQITGDATIRGVTRPLNLQADLYRVRGSDPNDLSRVQLRLRGALSRSAFGITGYPRLLADKVQLDILAELHAAE